jgi:hypothetical protein
LYLIDTNVVSELWRAKPHGAVVGWLSQTPDYQLHLPAVVLGELQAGVEMTRARDAAKAEAIESWIDQVEQTWNVLPMDGRTFRVWGRFMHKRSDHLIEDAMIAAIALVNNLTVATRNLRDFTAFGVPTFDPFTWSAETP